MTSKLADIIKDLALTASGNEKIAILTKHKDHPKLKYIFLWTYNPMVNYYVKKLSKTTKSGGQLSLDKDTVFYQFGDLLLKLNGRQFTGHAALAEIESFFNSLDKESFDLAQKVLFRDLRCSVTDTSANKVWPNLIPTFEVQLANKFDPEKPSAEKYYASRKKDGLRCMYVSGSGMYTRQGKRISGFEFIEDELQLICDKFQVGGIDGELFTKEIDFSAIQGAVMRDKNIDVEQKKKIRFNVFAVVKDFHKREIFKSTSMMLDAIDNIFEKTYNYVVKVPQILISADQVDEIHDSFVAEGYEGIMLRSVDVSYDFKRSKHLLKFKKFLEEDFKLVGVFEGEGKYAGKLGGFSVEGTYSGQVIKSDVGSGFTDEDREEFWKNQKKLIGETVEIKFQGVTPDFSLRFPVFLKFKLDRK